MNWRDAFPTDYLAADDLPAGRAFTLHVSRVVLEKVQSPEPRKQDKDRDLIVSFAELDAKAKKAGKKAKRWIPCKSAARVVRSMYGKETDSWIGKPITLVQITCDAFGDRDVPCIRAVHEFRPSRSGCRSCFRGDAGKSDRRAIQHQVSPSAPVDPQIADQVANGPVSAGEFSSGDPAQPDSDKPSAGIRTNDAPDPPAELSAEQLLELYATLEVVIREAASAKAVYAALERSAALTPVEREALDRIGHARIKELSA